MARQRRGSGGRRPGPATPLDLSSTLGSLLRTTLEQVSVVGEAALERARASRDRGMARASQELDTAVLERKRRDALARLGAAVYRLALRGELDLVGERADIARLLMRIEDLDARFDDELGRSPGNGDDDDDDDDDDGWGFEEHRAARPGRRGVGSPGRGRSRRGRDQDDEADVVSSSSDWRPPRPRERMRVWRPTLPSPDAGDDTGSAGDRGEDHEAARPEARPRSRDDTAAAQAHGRGRSRRRGQRDEQMDEPGTGDARGSNRSPRGGGIAFVDDPVHDEESDLAGYMHDDDVADRDA